MNPITGFSKLSKSDKLNYLINEYLPSSTGASDLIKSFWQEDQKSQKLFDEFSENTISNFIFPYGVVPNVLINNRLYAVPMVIEESSVVAACAKSANFWLKRGGFKAKVLSTQKIGQVHFYWNGRYDCLQELFKKYLPELMALIAPELKSMESRGGGLEEIKLKDFTKDEPGLFQFYCLFETCDAMGANFINTVLEAIAENFKKIVKREFPEDEELLDVVMSILSNYTPDCLVEVSVDCSIEELGGQEYADKFIRAIRIAHIDPHRAATHNKGILNGVDAVVLSTGNDFRAVEACAHTFAAKDGRYRSLTHAWTEKEHFYFRLTMPLAVGTVGGLTALHPMAKISLEMLDNPSAKDLMKIIGSIGLAQNFGAINSLVTTGIQKGHMKMHLMNILNTMNATEDECQQSISFFQCNTVSHSSVKNFLQTLRNYQ